MARGKYKEWLEEDKLLLLESWARDGMLDDDIAKKIGINRSTLYDWKKRFPDFDNALKKGKEVVDVMVENALLKRALGYETEERKAKKIKVGDYVKETTEVVRKFVPPDVTAQIFWLKNRRPDKWRDKPEIIHADVYEDDGLLTALSNSVEDIDDDSDFLNEVTVDGGV